MVFCFSGTHLPGAHSVREVNQDPRPVPIATGVRSLARGLEQEREGGRDPRVGEECTVHSAVLVQGETHCECAMDTAKNSGLDRQEVTIVML